MSKSGTRALNGMGSIRKRKDGTYEGRYTGSDGKQHSVYAKTPKACGEALRAATHSVDNGSWLEPSTLSVAQWLNTWLADYQGHTTTRTVQVYRGLVDRYITPVIGVVRLTALSPIHVRKVVSEMQKKGRAVSTIRCAHGVISAACNAAIEAKLIKSNPAEGMKLPQRVKTKFHIVDREQIPAFVAAARDDVNGNALIFLLLTGLRAAELRGLQWADVDLDAASMNIHQQIPCHGAPAFAPPKDGSARTIQLTPQAVALLKQQRKDQAAARLAGGEKWKTNDLVDDLVFRSARGHFLSESVLAKATHAVGAKIGIPELHPHDLRHSYAVAALRSGADIKTVQNNLGHKNAAMTLDIYAAYTTDAGKVAAEKLSKYFGDALN